MDTLPTARKRGSARAEPLAARGPTRHQAGFPFWEARRPALFQASSNRAGSRNQSRKQGRDDLQPPPASPTPLLSPPSWQTGWTGTDGDPRPPPPHPLPAGSSLCLGPPTPIPLMDPPARRCDLMFPKWKPNLHLSVVFLLSSTPQKGSLPKGDTDLLG